MRTRAFAASLAALALMSCQADQAVPEEQASYPALWEIADETGAAEGWLFGTVHALPPELKWRSAEFDRVAAMAPLLVVEVSGLDDRRTLESLFRTMAYDAAPAIPISERLNASQRQRLSAVLGDAGIDPRSLDPMESWAAALAIAELGRINSSDHGADRVLLEEFAGREIFELEGAEPQLSIFNDLPETEQRDLLVAVVEEVAKPEGKRTDLAAIWSSGDLDELQEITRQGMLADPELRDALLVRRNKAWAAQIENLLSASPKPLIAVGAGHLLGEDGVPALLEARGYTVRRIQ